MKLTDAQRDLLAWLMEQNERGSRNDVIELYWPPFGTDFNVSRDAGEAPAFAKRALLESLDDMGLVRLHTANIGFDIMVCQLYAAAYEALGGKTEQTVTSDSSNAGDPPNTGRLRRMLELFSLNELKTIALDLGADPDELASEPKSALIRDLVQYAENRDALWELVHAALSLK